MTEKEAINIFMQQKKQEKKRARDSVIDFVAGALDGDVKRMAGSIESLEWGKGYYGGGWSCAFKRLAKEGPVPDLTRKYFLQIFLDYGDDIRDATNDDLAYMTGLRALLPRYDGPPVLLYRGESAYNRSRRTYGPSWSANKDVARNFALRNARHYTSGTVLLSTVAEPSAIITAPAIIDDQYEEREYLVDRRFLSKVCVEERFAFEPPRTQSAPT